MTRKTWLWISLGSAALLMLRRDRSVLALPIASALRVTPHGDFGATRSGPPRHAHQGIDIAATPGSRIVAVGDGVIVAVNPGLGKTVRKLRLDVPGAWSFGPRRIDHVVYADLGTPLVSPGHRVRKGDAVALVDKSGFFHFAVKSGEDFFDPKHAGLFYRPSEVA
jgi:murein DD-endopeptidase MepM/ murein hydrolase activator NlpD